MATEDKICQFDSAVQGMITCICGEPGSAQSCMARLLRDGHAIVLEGEEARYYENKDLGHSLPDIQEINRRIAAIALHLSMQGHDVIIISAHANVAYDILKSEIPNIQLVKACCTS